MKTEEHDDLWQLLGKAKPLAPSPFFSRNVLRVVRATAPERRSWLTGFTLRWRIFAVSSCAFLAGGLVLWQQSSPAKTERAADSEMMLARTFSTSPDYQVVSHLDELLDSEKNSVWLEN